MITKTTSKYLQFQTHISRQTNSHSTVHITHWQLLPSVPTQNPIGLLCFRRAHSHLTSVLCAFCKRLYTEPQGRLSVYAYDKYWSRVLAILKLIISDRLFSLVRLRAVFVLASRAAHKNQHFDVVSFTICTKCTVCNVLPVCPSNTEQWRTQELFFGEGMGLRQKFFRGASTNSVLEKGSERTGICWR
jgi:hypothetical protein